MMFHFSLTILQESCSLLVVPHGTHFIVASVLADLTSPPPAARAVPRLPSRVSRPSPSSVSIRAPRRTFAGAHAAPKVPGPTKGGKEQPVPKGYARVYRCLLRSNRAADATGPEKVQLTMDFYHGPSLSDGPFGTLDNPVIVRCLAAASSVLIRL